MTKDNTPAMDAKTKELLEAKAAYVAWANYQEAPSNVKRLMKAIAAFEPPPVKVEPKRIWVNVYDKFTTSHYTEMHANDAACAPVRTAVPYIEITPDICIVRAGEEWSEDEKIKLLDKYIREPSIGSGLVAVINAIRTQTAVK